jgi:dTDP-glucose pyrophosphorylase
MGLERADVIGLIPAAGRGTRLGPLPCSKELYPVGFRHDDASREPRAKVVSHYLLEKFRHAGISRAYVILRHGKWDVPTYFGDGQRVGLQLAYLVIGDSLGPADTLDRAYPFIRNNCVAFGFPDVLFGPDDVFDHLLRRLAETDADIVLGLYPGSDSRQMDMVDVDADGRVRAIILKPPSTALRYGWICAVWRPAFTECLHAFLTSERARPDLDKAAYRDIDPQGDLPVGAAIKAAVDTGLRVHALSFPDHTYLDIGTPDNLVEAVRANVRP